VTIRQPGCVHSSDLDQDQDRAANYHNIPAELKAIPQWCGWRYEYRSGEKATKVPIDAKTGLLASVTDPATWAEFEEAEAGEAAYGCDGIGFIFTHNDIYCGIDIDDAKGDAEALERQRKIYEAFNSYTELSPSGSGIHIIIKAKLPHGRRRGSVEMYPHGRFFTMTGHVINNVGIAERQELAEVLFDELGGEKAAMAGLQPDREASQSDEAVVASLCSDPALAALYGGDLSGYGGDHSGADQALCNALSARSGNRAQVERLWLNSPLGQREKTQSRADYRQRTVERAFDRVPLASVSTNFTVNGKPFIASATPPAETPTIIDAADLEAMPASPRLDMWGGNVPVGQTTVAFGGGGSGKSLLLQQLCTSTALGRPSRLCQVWRSM
jgi:primase-polymerase (primpol)-like protein